MTPNNTETVEARVDQNNPELQAQVHEFIQSAGGNIEAKAKVEIPPNDDFNMPNPNDVMLTEALVATEKLDISDLEKQKFVKALLNNEPVKFSVTLFGGQLKVELRSRSLYEQQRIFDVLNKDRNDGTIPLVPENGKMIPDLASEVTRMHKYCMAIMIQRVNGDLFSELELPDTDSVEEAQKKLHLALEGPVKHIQGVRWTGLMNAMRIFETKCAKMSTEANNEDFWKPRVTA